MQLALPSTLKSVSSMLILGIRTSYAGADEAHVARVTFVS